jgi:copper(I)-binding protein
MKRLVPIVAIALALAACGAPAPDENAHIDNHGQASAARYETMFRLPVLPGRPGAGYFSVAVPADHGALISVTSPQAGRIEMHETSREGEMTRMRPIQRIAPEDGQIVLMPRGRHLMLFEVNPSLAPGGTAQFVLHFENGQTRTIDARVIDAGAGHGGH